MNRHDYANRIRQALTPGDYIMAQILQKNRELLDQECTNWARKQRERAKIQAWLEKKNHTIWGRGFNIKSTDGLQEATDWIEQELGDLIAFMDSDAAD